MNLFIIIYLDLLNDKVSKENKLARTHSHKIKEGNLRMAKVKLTSSLSPPNKLVLYN